MEKKLSLTPTTTKKAGSPSSSVRSSRSLPTPKHSSANKSSTTDGSPSNRSARSFPTNLKSAADDDKATIERPPASSASTPLKMSQQHQEQVPAESPDMSVRSVQTSASTPIMSGNKSVVTAESPSKSLSTKMTAASPNSKRSNGSSKSTKEDALKAFDAISEKLKDEEELRALEEMRDAFLSKFDKKKNRKEQPRDFMDDDSSAGDSSTDPELTTTIESLFQYFDFMDGGGDGNREDDDDGFSDGSSVATGMTSATSASGVSSDVVKHTFFDRPGSSKRRSSQQKSLIELILDQMETMGCRPNLTMDDFPVGCHSTLKDIGCPGASTAAAATEVDQLEYQEANNFVFSSTTNKGRNLEVLSEDDETSAVESVAVPATTKDTSEVKIEPSQKDTPVRSAPPQDSTDDTPPAETQSRQSMASVGTLADTPSRQSIASEASMDDSAAERIATESAICKDIRATIANGEAPFSCETSVKSIVNDCFGDDATKGRPADGDGSTSFVPDGGSFIEDTTASAMKAAETIQMSYSYEKREQDEEQYPSDDKSLMSNASKFLGTVATSAKNTAESIAETGPLYADGVDDKLGETDENGADFLESLTNNLNQVTGQGAKGLSVDDVKAFFDFTPMVNAIKETLARDDTEIRRTDTEYTYGTEGDYTYATYDDDTTFVQSEVQSPIPNTPVESKQGPTRETMIVDQEATADVDTLAQEKRVKFQDDLPPPPPPPPPQVPYLHHVPVSDTADDKPPTGQDQEQPISESTDEPQEAARQAEAQLEKISEPSDVQKIGDDSETRISNGEQDQEQELAPKVEDPPGTQGLVSTMEDPPGAHSSTALADAAVPVEGPITRSPPSSPSRKEVEELDERIRLIEEKLTPPRQKSTPESVSNHVTTPSEHKSQSASPKKKSKSGLFGKLFKKKSSKGHAALDDDDVSSVVRNQSINIKKEPASPPSSDSPKESLTEGRSHMEQEHEEPVTEIEPSSSAVEALDGSPQETAVATLDPKLDAQDNVATVMDTMEKNSKTTSAAVKRKQRHQALLSLHVQEVEDKPEERHWDSPMLPQAEADNDWYKGFSEWGNSNATGNHDEDDGETFMMQWDGQKWDSPSRKTRITTTSITPPSTSASKSSSPSHVSQFPR